MLFSLVTSGLIITIANFFGKEIAGVVSSLIFVPWTGALVVLSIILVIRGGVIGSHGKAWVFFAIFAAFWFIATQVWTVYAVVYHAKPFPSGADFFYLAGYPPHFLFLLFYLQPFKKVISKKMITLGSLIAVTVLIPNFYMTLDTNAGEDELATILGTTYPVADAIMLVPAIIGVVLFFRGEVNFLWSLLLFGILIQVAADTAFQYFSLDNSYYNGHPIDILYLWPYILFSFGIYDHIKIYKNKKNSYQNKENLR